jgi:hypothetical protein
MSTNATISVITPKGEVLTVYNHWDGYPDFLLNRLNEHYNNYTDAFALVSQGNISVVKERCDGDGAHTFDNPIPDQTIYYGRDRGEQGQAVDVQMLEGFNIDRHPYGKQAYNYIFANGKWQHLDAYLAEKEEGGMIDDVIDQIRVDVANEDFTAIAELLESLPEDRLYGYLTQ